MALQEIQIHQLTQPSMQDMEEIVDIVADKCGTQIDPQEYRDRHSGDLIFVAEDPEANQKLGIIALHLVGEREIEVTAHAVRSGLNGSEAKVHEGLQDCTRRLGELVGRNSVVVDTTNVSDVERPYKQQGFSSQGGTILAKKIS